MRPAKAIAATGLTVIREPEDVDQCCVDIVFVHGLQGHPRRTWTANSVPGPSPVPLEEASKNKLTRGLGRLFKSDKHAAVSASSDDTIIEDSDDCFWPEDILTKECHAARIMTFGYESNVTNFFGGPVNQNTFYDHAKDLLAALNRKRRTCLGRLIVFVAHSLGGIIVKQALFAAKLAEGRPELKDIYTSTSALLFLGTPHRGSDYAAWGKIAERIVSAALFDTNARNVEHLTVNGEQLSQLAQNFESLVYARTFVIYSYQEAKGYKGVRLLNGKVVEPWSSVAGDPNRERVETINANHMDMCRFTSREDPGYQIVGADIESIVQGYSEERQAQLAKELEDFLQSLSAPDFIGAHIPEPYHNTAEWLLHDVSFRMWLDEERGLFWVKGKPGSGKSTLMKHMWLTLRFGGRPVIPLKSLKAAFFFNARGNPLEQNAMSMLKGMLFQILHSSYDMYKSLLPYLRHLTIGPPRKQPSTIQWDQKTLTMAMLHLMSQATSMRIVLFIDALDESNDEDRDLIIHLIEQFAQASRASGSLLHIIFSSRHDTSVDIGRCSCISLEEENYRDITLYVEKELISRANERRKVDRHAELAVKVIEKANGVFLWVNLVVPRLRRLINRGDTMRKLLQVLDEIPTRLEELFEDILRRITSDCLPETMRMIQVAILAFRPFELDEFRHALAFGPDNVYRSFKDWQESDDYVEDGEQMRQRIQSRTGGLLEVHADYKGHSFGPHMDHSSSRPRVPVDENVSVRKLQRDWVTTVAEALIKIDSLQDNAVKFERQRQGQAQAGPNLTADSSKSEAATEEAIDGDQREAARRRPTSSQWHVRLIHETAKSFFLRGPGFSILLSLIQSSPMSLTSPGSYCSPSGSFIDGGHDYITKTCLKYFEMRELRWAWSRLARAAKIRPGENTALYPFVRYILENWMSHIEQAERGGMSQTYVAQLILDEQPRSTDYLIAAAAKHNLVSWLRWLKDDRNVDFDTPNFVYGRPMQSAVMAGNVEAATLLLQGGANVNGTTGGSRTCLARAIPLKNREMIGLLYRYGAWFTQPHWLPPEGTVVHIEEGAWMYCHQCDYEWARGFGGFTCPNCSSEFTEVLEVTG